MPTNASTRCMRGAPVPPVGAHVVVQQEALKVVRSQPPIKAEVQRQVGRHVLPPCPPPGDQSK
eukprot:1180511-Prorocentrum_minimum.AAC.1